MGYKRSILISASEDRLEKLIKQRIKTDTDKSVIDKHIWDLFGEKWCIMFTDLSGFSRNVEKFGIIHFLQTIYESERILIPIIEEHDGILLKIEGDSFLVMFRNVKKALQASIQMQNVLKEYNTEKADEEKILLCIGLGFGDILRIGDIDVFGQEVNSASKLGEDLAAPWEILITQSVKDNALDMDNITFEEIKNVPTGIKKAFKVNY
jgi:adenylate cyclase